MEMKTKCTNMTKPGLTTKIQGKCQHIKINQYYQLYGQLKT